MIKYLIYLSMEWHNSPAAVRPLSCGFVATAEFFTEERYIYQYKDHLGNVRMSYANSNNILEIVDVNDYYPFGMNHLDSNNSAFFGQSAYQNYKFQEQELQETGFYAFKWRQYMPDVGRFFNIDPLAEKYPYNSTYAFSENRVIDGRELEGLEWASTKDDKGVITSRQLTVSITNDSKLDNKQFNKLIESTKADFSKTYGADGATANLVVSDDATIQVTIVNQTSETITLESGEEVSTFKGGVTAVLGESQKNSFTVTAVVDGDKRVTSDITRSFNHEAAHTAGVDHPWGNTTPSDMNQNSKDVKNSAVRNNLANSDGNPNENVRSSDGTKLTTGQFQKMDEVIESQQPQ
ncbi:MAG: hypothetical protein LBE36_01690 [Flavobacteriaceae bacterium]|jgi:RHS repeat-associated protein|nr:hypothetical protein [Flavobacteriaceae bacterium]